MVPPHRLGATKLRVLTPVSILLWWIRVVLGPISGLNLIGDRMMLVSAVVLIGSSPPVSRLKHCWEVVLILQVLELKHVTPRQWPRTLLPDNLCLSRIVHWTLRSPCVAACLCVVRIRLGAWVVAMSMPWMHRTARADVFRRTELSVAPLSRVWTKFRTLMLWRLQNSRLLIVTMVPRTPGSTPPSGILTWPLLKSAVTWPLLVLLTTACIGSGGAVSLVGSVLTRLVVMLDVPLTLVMIGMVTVVRTVLLTVLIIVTWVRLDRGPCVLVEPPGAPDIVTRCKGMPRRPCVYLVVRVTCYVEAW